jgi:phosphoserine phosphatase
MCGEMVTMNSGVSVDRLYAAGQEFFEEVISSRIFPEMQQLTQRLAENGCEIWAVSSTNDWVVEAGASRFGIPRDRVLAACVHANDGKATDRLVRVPTDELKVTAIREVIGRPIDAVFGNSIHDQAMLEIAKYPFCINPNPDLERVAQTKNWPIYWPNGRQPLTAEV